jgi:signal transduction histidine kinase
MMLSIAIWSISYGFDLASNTLSQIEFFTDLEYLGITTLPLSWFVFCLYFCGKESLIKKPLNLISLSIFPILTLIVVWTNSRHHLYYKSIVLNNDGPFPMAEIIRGPWYIVFTIYFYILLLVGCYFIFIKFKNSDPIYKRQNYIILVAVFIPWLANIAYLAGIKPLGLIDVTPFSFIIATFLIFIGIFRYKLFDIIPIAREKVLELMRDGFFILDDKIRIIDYNKSIKRYIEPNFRDQLIGASFENIFPNQPIILEHLKTRKSGKIEFNVCINDEILYLEADIVFFKENKIDNIFSIIKLQDLTIFRKDAIIFKRQANELEKLNQLKDRIFTIIAHDLRGPLVNVSEVLKLISDDQVTNEEIKNIAPILTKDIKYTTDLLENILHWSRSQLKGFGIKREFFDIRDLINNEISYHLSAANEKKIKLIHTELSKETVYADLLMIQIVIRNVINNAIKFCYNNCEIKITISSHKENTRQICIEDNGIGIPKGVIEKLFCDEYISTRGTRDEKGTGLGLVVCKDFMRRNDGNITVKSVKGVSTKFCLTLPTS